MEFLRSIPHLLVQVNLALEPGIYNIVEWVYTLDVVCFDNSILKYEREWKLGFENSELV